MGLTIVADPGETVRLAETDTDRAAGVSKSAGNERMGVLSEQLGELQELLFAARRHAVLIVLQGMAHRPRGQEVVPESRHRRGHRRRPRGPSQ